MANPERGEVGITVGDQRYTLRPTFNAICSLEEMTGRTIGSITADAERTSMSAVRALVWAYLQEYHSDEIKTLDDAGRWMQRVGGLQPLVAALAKTTLLNAPPDEATNGQRAARGRPPKAQGGARSISTAGASD